MSTRFAQKKVYVQPVTQEQGEEKQAVEWLFASDLDTMAVSISDRSGGVKIDIGANRRNPFLYRNEILAILDKEQELRRYLADHPQAKDTPPSKAAQRANALVLTQVNEAKTKQLNDMVKSMRDAGVSEDLITAAVSKIK